MSKLRTLFSVAQKKSGGQHPSRYYSKPNKAGEGAQPEQSNQPDANEKVLRALGLVRYRYYTYINKTNDSGEVVSLLVSLEDLNSNLKAKLSSTKTEQENIFVLLNNIAHELSEVVYLINYRIAEQMLDEFKSKYKINNEANIESISGLYDPQKVKGLIDLAHAKISNSNSQNVDADSRLQVLKDVNEIKEFVNYYVQRDLYAMYRRLLYNAIYRNAFAYTNNLEKSKNRIGGLLESLDDYEFYPLGRGGLGYTINTDTLDGIKQSYSQEEAQIDLRTFKSLSISEQRFIILVLTEIVRLFAETLKIDREPSSNTNSIYRKKTLEILTDFAKTLTLPNQEQTSSLSEDEKLYFKLRNLDSFIFGEDTVNSFQRLYPVVCWLVRTELQLYMDELGQEVTKDQTEKIIHDPNDRKNNLARLRNASHFFSTKDVLLRKLEEKSRTLTQRYLEELGSKSDAEIQKLISALTSNLYTLYRQYSIVLTSPFVQDLIINFDFIKEFAIRKRNTFNVKIDGIDKMLFIPVLFYDSQADSSQVSTRMVESSIQVYRTSTIDSGEASKFYGGIFEHSQEVRKYAASLTNKILNLIDENDANVKIIKQDLLKGIIANALSTFSNSSYVILVPTFVVPLLVKKINMKRTDGESESISVFQYDRKYANSNSLRQIIQFYEDFDVKITIEEKLEENTWFELNPIYKSGDVFIYDTQQRDNQIQIDSIQENLFVTR